MRGTVEKALRRRAKEDFRLKKVLNVQKRYDELKKNYKEIRQGKSLSNSNHA